MNFADILDLMAHFIGNLIVFSAMTITISLLVIFAVNAAVKISYNLYAMGSDLWADFRNWREDRAD